jgi:hypothetical protein
MMNFTAPEGTTFSDIAASLGISEATVRDVNPESGDEPVMGQTITIPVREAFLANTGFEFRDQELEKIARSRRAGDKGYGLSEYLRDSTSDVTRGEFPSVEFDPPATEEQFAMIAENKQLLSWLQEDESFELQPYSLGNDKGGVTVATGIDFGNVTEEQLRKMGVSESTIAKMLPAIGVKGAASKELAGKMEKLDYNEAAELDRVFMQKNKRDLEDLFGDRYETMTTGEKAVAMSAIHQYGKAGFKSQNAYKQLMSGDKEGLRANLLDWRDKTPDLSEGINKRYARYAERI